MGIHYQMYYSLKLSAVSGIDRQRKMMNERRVCASLQAINNPFIFRGLCRNIYIYMYLQLYLIHLIW